MLIVRSALSHDLLKALFCATFHEWIAFSPNPCCSISSHPADNGLHPISFPLKKSLPANFSGEKVARYLSCFSSDHLLLFFFLLPSITDEVTIYSINFLVLESMELLLPFWRVNILARLVPPYLGFSFPQTFDFHLTRAC